jgi:hypothetical protein
MADAAGAGAGKASSGGNSSRAGAGRAGPELRKTSRATRGLKSSEPTAQVRELMGHGEKVGACQGLLFSLVRSLETAATP